MERESLINCFRDTLQMSNSGVLRAETRKAKQSNKVYKEGFVYSPKARKLDMITAAKTFFTPGCKKKSYKKPAEVIVEANTSFAAAKRYSGTERVAVLNFANPENPGGGVQLGAMAQEECLCRSSNLFLCLSDPKVNEDFYAYHRNQRNCFYSDRLIYTRDVTVFKDDSAVPELMPKQEWFHVDVITCAAPYLAKRQDINLTALTLLFKSRIKNIIEAARDNHVECLILGAFGCGAFKNPPTIVAEAFQQVINEQNYQEYFKHIIFAIKPTSEHCENLHAFSEKFDYYNFHGGECTLLLNKRFSILGDSISTLEGYNPDGYKVFYSGENCMKSGVNEMADTWWGKVIDFFGGELLINNSWSGSRVTKLPFSETLFPSGCSNERTSALHIGAVTPDVIIVYLGTNDWAYGANVGYETQVLDGEEYDFNFFDFAYESMIQKLKNHYPNSEIWCCTLCETYMSNNPDFKFPHKYAGTHIEEYNDIIRSVSNRNKCRLIDLYSYKMPYDSTDGTHPTVKGMNTLATSVIQSIIRLF